MAGSRCDFSYAVAICVLFIFVGVGTADDVLPYSTDPRLKIQLFAESPQIVTPTGIDVDHRGRVWVIESNTHFPPAGYVGHPTDRIMVMEGQDNDGKVEKITVFLDGLIHGMSIAAKPVWLDYCQPGGADATNADATVQSRPFEVFIATRREILLCTDSNDDLQCDHVKQLVHLDTTGNYPHNGLAGFAFDALGYMYFGFGENLGADYKIIGSDGTTLSGGGEGGNVYRCRPDGSKLEHWSTGFWNPHASCFDSFGHMFTLDNDPDSRPPCRLLHDVRGGDYGYRFRNGRKGTHPFTCWNGEIPGTLPMVSGTGEAPSGIVCYESVGFPEDYVGTLLVGSWGDHRIDKFDLKARGTSFEAIPQPVIKGGENFRPVGLAIAPDGSLYASDWVLKDYHVHGQGRIWRISAKDHAHSAPPFLTEFATHRSTQDLETKLESPVLNVRRLAAKLLATKEDGRKSLGKIRHDQARNNRTQYEVLHATPGFVEQIPHVDIKTADLTDPFTLSDAVNQTAAALADLPATKPIVSELKRLHHATADKTFRQNELQKIVYLLALRKKFPQETSFAHLGIEEPEQSVRRLAVQWIGEEKLKDLRSDVERVLESEPMTTDLFMACLASLSLFDGTTPKEFEKTPPASYILSIVTNSKRPSSLRATALRMLPPSQQELNAQLLTEMLSSGNTELRRETIRTLQHSPIA
jgi:putative membrane-bound dehydrogenase-like protein